MRIIGGQFKRRNLEPTPKGLKGVRPTHDMIREAVFNLSAGFVENARVLDLFCGTGAIALEALSRGAREAWLVDRSREAIELAKKNCARLGVLDRVRVFQEDALRFLERDGKTREPFDFIYSDPPYESNLTEQVVERVEKNLVLKQDGLAVCEYNGELDFGSNSELALFDQRRYGKSWIGLWRWKPAET